MIIAHYPGSGGHRYGLFLKKLSFDVPGVSMHQQDFVCYDYRYLTVDTPQNEKFNPVLIKHTHTLNHTLLEKFFPGHEIVKIKADLKKSLYREWLETKTILKSIISYVAEKTFIQQHAHVFFGKHVPSIWHDTDFQPYKRPKHFNFAWVTLPILRSNMKFTIQGSRV